MIFMIIMMFLIPVINHLYYKNHKNPDSDNIIALLSKKHIYHFDSLLPTAHHEIDISS